MSIAEWSGRDWVAYGVAVVAVVCGLLVAADGLVAGDYKLALWAAQAAAYAGLAAGWRERARKAGYFD
jgi:hypothetical protein